jgi:hypothetical protein
VRMCGIDTTYGSSRQEGRKNGDFLLHY